MDLRDPELHPSALSPLEYKAFTHYLEILPDARSTAGPGHITSDKRIERHELRDFTVQRLKLKSTYVDEIYAKLPMSLSTSLSYGQALAVLRLLGHARSADKTGSHARRGVDLAMVFIPADPPPLDPSPTHKREPPVPPPRKKQISPSALMAPNLPPVPTAPPFASRPAGRMSLPAELSLNPFNGPSQYNRPPVNNSDIKGKGRANSVSSIDAPRSIGPAPATVPVSSDFQRSSTNPFRHRVPSAPSVTSHSKSSKAPPLPPRKPSLAIDHPINPSSRKSHKVVTIQASSSDSSIKSGRKGTPTSTSEPSPIIQQALIAAEKFSSRKRIDSTYQVIRHSTESSRQQTPLHPMDTGRKTELIAQVNEALKEAEDDTPQPPPKRGASGRSKSKLPSLAKRFTTDKPGMTPWSCVDLLHGIKGEQPYAMIILNQPITRKDIFLRAWSACQLHLCADGGANRLHDIFNAEQRANYLPSLIKGDLDSLRSDVKDYYSSRNVSIKHDGDEYSTDLMKCIKEVEAEESRTGRQFNLLLMGGLSGRVDQTVHTMALLHKLRKTRPNSFILSSESLAWVLDEGAHLIEIDHSTMGQTCGILPVGIDNAYVKTEGLKWNLDWDTSFDGEVSTSNHLLPSEPVVQLTTSKPVLCCIEVKSNLPPMSISQSQHRDSNSGIRRAVSLSGPSSSAQAAKAADELSRGIRGLGIGVAKAAEGVGKEIEWLKGGRGGRKPSLKAYGQERTRLVGSDEEDDISAIPNRNGHPEEDGWKQLS